MRPLRSRQNLMDVCMRIAPTNACKRAINEGRATVLGGFTPVEGLPYYLTRVTSAYNKVWYLLVHVATGNQCVKYSYHSPPWEPSWECWDGQNPLTPTKLIRTWNLFDGDTPEEVYKLKKDKENGRPTTSTET